jgi:hypothetical protein
MRRRSALVVAALALPLALGACAVRAAAPPPEHPASPSAPAGRLAGAPASLRPGVVEYPDVPAVRAPAATPHHHHHAP